MSQKLFRIFFVKCFENRGRCNDHERSHYSQQKCVQQQCKFNVHSYQVVDYSISSIVEKKRLKDEKLEREFPEIWPDFSLQVFDKTLVNMF